MSTLTKEKLSIHLDSNLECDSQQRSCIGSETSSNFSSWSEGPIDEKIFIEETNYSNGFCKYLGCPEITNENKKRKLEGNHDRTINGFLDLNEEEDSNYNDVKKSKKFIKKSQLCYKHYRIIYANDNYSGKCSNNGCSNNIKGNKRFCNKHYKKFISKNQCNKCDKIKFKNDLCKRCFKEFYFCIFKNNIGEECGEKILNIGKSLCKKHYNSEYFLEKRREKESDIEFVMKKIETSIEKKNNRKNKILKKVNLKIKSDNSKITSIFPITENSKKKQV